MGTTRDDGSQQSMWVSAVDLVERPFAHLYETGGIWRVYLRGHPNILKRLLVQARIVVLSRWLISLTLLITIHLNTEDFTSAC